MKSIKIEDELYAKILGEKKGKETISECLSRMVVEQKEGSVDSIEKHDEPTEVSLMERIQRIAQATRQRLGV